RRGECSPSSFFFQAEDGIRDRNVTGVQTCALPILKDTNIKTRPFLDFSAGYVQRALDAFPKQGTKAPWKVKQNYLFDFIMLKLSKLDDGILQFSHPIKKKKGVFRSRRTAAL